jgi:hypothetical protein
LSVKENDMTDEQQLRALLTTATELPDELPPPIQHLIGLGRRRRTLRTRMRAGTIAAIAIVAVAAPSAIYTLGHAGPRQVRGRTSQGPSASQIARFQWSSLARSPLGKRSNPVVAMAGKDLIELIHNRRGGTTFGAAFSPATGRWRLIAPLPAKVGFDYGVTAWTGHQLFFVGLNATCGTPGAICLRSAGLYNPATNRWTITVLPRAMDTVFRLAAAWNGRDIVLAAADSSDGRLRVASYDPVTGHWQMITPALSPRHPPRFVAMVATSDRTILWSLWDRQTVTSHRVINTRGVDVFALTGHRAWHRVTGNWPQKRTVDSPVFTGRAILVSPGELFCGVACSSHFAILHGYFADAATLRRTLIPTGPLAESEPPYIWTGRAIIAMNLAGRIPPPHPLPLDAAALYDPAANRWTRLPAPPGHPAFAVIPVWTGSEMLALTIRGNLLAFSR